MRNLLYIFVTLLLLLPACTKKTEVNSAQFSHAVYTGTDAWFDKEIDSDNQYLNPILSGFYPDPSICRKGDDYFLIHSSFAYYPGIPIFHSRDLVNWKQIGFVLNRPLQLELNGLRLTRGIFAPAIEYNPHNDTFYVITTNVDGIGNFLVKTDDPFKENWSDPILLPEVGGIDPSLFFDEDGKGYIVNNDGPQGEPEYEGHRAIWLHQFDSETDQTFGDAKMIVDAGVDKSQKPIWIEAPHLYKVNGVYYLMCAEGGTSVDHSEVIFRTNSLDKPFVPYSENPILTQRNLPDDRAESVTSTGHADIIDTPDGDWYAVFLGCRPYEGNYYYTGRETFLLPVTWKDDFPIILPKGEAVPTVVDKSDLQPAPNFLTGNFTWIDDFESNKLNYAWQFARTPILQWWQLGNASIKVDAIETNIYNLDNPAYIGRRVQHQDFEFTIEMKFTAKAANEIAGVLCLQDENHNIILGKTAQDDKQIIVLDLADGESTPTRLNSVEVPIEFNKSLITLRVKAKNAQLSFYVAFANNDWIVIADSIDAKILTTEKAGGFIGATIGMYATSNHPTK